jgi:heptosyltransferase-1
MSKRVLLIKLTSMGDLMHALPAITDASREIKGIEFDWVIDEAFQEVASWHKAVQQVIPSAHRRWKKNLTQSIANGQLKAFYRKLNADDYDVVIDAQNNLKSALITGLRRGHSHGLDKSSIREKPAHWAYHYHHKVDKSQHAITRQRQLFAEAIGYEMPQTRADYGIDRSRMQLPDIELPNHYLVFVHNASWTTKLWPESHWHQLIAKAAQAGYNVLLPCGNDEELQRAQRLAKNHDNAIALPKLSLSQVGAILDQAIGAVCCDTGLCHLAGLLGVPSVSFYGPTSAALIGATGFNQQHLIARSDAFECAPCYGRTCDFDGTQQHMGACMQSFSADTAWQQLTSLIATRVGSGDSKTIL